MFGKIIYDEYLLYYNPTHHRANKDGYVRIHLVQAEKKIGRLLKDGEVVHHLDKNKHNNELDNLIVFRSNADHSAFHKGVRAIKCEDGIWECPDKGKKICPVCNKKEIKKTYGLCLECLKKEKLKSYLDRIPDRDKLKNEIYNNSFDEIGRKYNVTANAIKKWCKFYNLPYLRYEIKLIPKEEWETEVFSETTQNNILMYYEERNANDAYIIDYYKNCCNLAQTAKKFHKDRNTLRALLESHNVEMLQRGKSNNSKIFILYKNNKKIETFYTLQSLANWFIDKNLTNLKIKTLRAKISKYVKNQEEIFGYIVKEENFN